jgi:hypothetical protein
MTALPPSLVIPALGFGCFFALVLYIIAPVARRLFLGRYGRRHRLFGIAFLTWLLVGFAHLLLGLDGVLSRLGFNVLLSLLGLGLTLSAAADFKHHHSKVKNPASGVLEPEATVTYSEMIEHAFYHILNLFQIVFLHVVTDAPPAGWPLLGGPAGRRVRLALVMLATSPWLVRHRFPVNSFSDNYNKVKTGKDPRTLVAVLYRCARLRARGTPTQRAPQALGEREQRRDGSLQSRLSATRAPLTPPRLHLLLLVVPGPAAAVRTCLLSTLQRLKKYQYMFYKHALLHGLNLTVALRGAPSAEQLSRGELGLAAQPTFQLYWLSLNAAYVMEFFLQTLVKRRFMAQATMLALNQLLMLVSTLVAVQVLTHVSLPISAASLGLNMVHRSRPYGEMVNFAIIVALCSSVIA